MKRSDAVRAILGRILEAGTPPRFDYVNSGYAQVIDKIGWHARIHSPFNPTSSGTSISHLPNSLGLWLTDGPKVLKVYFDVEEIHIINMRRGEWETEFFGLPPFVGASMLQPWEYQRKRSRRW